MLVGNQPVGGNQQIRGVLAYTLGSIPAGSTISDVSLKLFSVGSQAGTISGVGNIEAHQITPNGNVANQIVEGQVTAAVWKTGSSWTTTGGDYGTTLSTSTVTDVNSNNTADAGDSYTFASSSAFVTAAQGALDNNLPLQLILFSPTAEANSTADNFIRFESDTGTTAPTGGTQGDYRPLLTVTYSTPEPASLGGIAACGLLLLRHRRTGGR